MAQTNKKIIDLEIQKQKIAEGIPARHHDDDEDKDVVPFKDSDLDMLNLYVKELREPIY